VSFICFDVLEDDFDKQIDYSKVKARYVSIMKKFWTNICNILRFKTNCTVSWTWSKDIRNASFICTKQLPWADTSFNIYNRTKHLF